MSKYYCQELNKSFETQKEMFDALKNKLPEIISLKKSERNSDNTSAKIAKRTETTKAPQTTPTDLEIGDTVKSVINTTNFIDSHRDCHIPGIWNKTAKEQQGKIYHVIDHKLGVDKVVGFPSDVNIEVKQMTWNELGFDYSGTTEALIFNTTMTEDSNESAFKAYKNGRPVQHSVRMRYVNIYYCVNSQEPEYKEEYANWLQYEPYVANKEELDLGYFWAVTEAMIVKEGSTVLFGSNEVTPQLKNIEPEDTQSEPSSTQQEDEAGDSHSATSDADRTELKTENFL